MRLLDDCLRPLVDLLTLEVVMSPLRHSEVNGLPKLEIDGTDSVEYQVKPTDLGCGR